jgi:signal transduction histidine kinase
MLNPDPTQGAGSTPIRVLVVDDEYGPRESIAFALRTRYEADTAERGAEALTLVGRNSYDVVILDIRMPEMDGIRVLDQLRKVDREVSVVMLTGYGTLQTAQQAIEGGANQYLRKPPDIPELLDSVRRQAEGTRLRRQQARAARDAMDLSSALKREIAAKEPHIWQARASVELVHDLVNPLSVLIGYSMLVSEEVERLAAAVPDKAEKVEKIRNHARVIERAAEFCQHLAENWRQTAKKTSEFAEVDLAKIAEEVKQVILFGNAAIRIATSERPPVVRGSRFDIARVFQNVLKNAIEAGATRVDVSFARKGARLEVLVSDDGPGMDAKTAANVLRGNFTTKEHGTGLGLSICRHILGAHGATLKLDTAPGAGTRIHMDFPAAGDGG